jgi:hypothetical protein
VREALAPVLEGIPLCVRPVAALFGQGESGFEEPGPWLVPCGLAARPEGAPVDLSRSLREGGDARLFGRKSVKRQLCLACLFLLFANAWAAWSLFQTDGQIEAANGKLAALRAGGMEREEKAKGLRERAAKYREGLSFVSPCVAAYEFLAALSRAGGATVLHLECSGKYAELLCEAEDARSAYEFARGVSEMFPVLNAGQPKFSGAQADGAHVRFSLRCELR